MHIPDGFIDGPASAAAGIVAIGGVGISLRRAGELLDDRGVPLAGLTAAFVFAAQMLNFPVASGTSGHLVGGLLASVLVGPTVGVVCVTVVLVVQALLFADGGLSALGLNIVNLALVPALLGYPVFVVLRQMSRRSRAPIVLASGLAAGISVVLASTAFVAEYAVGGVGGAPVSTVAAAMVGTHVVIGVGEGIITALVVGAVLSTRPDLVWGARDLAARRSAQPVVEPV